MVSFFLPFFGVFLDVDFSFVFLGVLRVVGAASPVNLSIACARRRFSSFF